MRFPSIPLERHARSTSQSTESISSATISFPAWKPRSSRQRSSRGRSPRASKVPTKMFDRLLQLFHTSNLTYDEHSLLRYDNVDPRAFDMTQWFNIVGTLGYLCWVGAYFLMIRKSFRD